MQNDDDLWPDIQSESSLGNYKEEIQIPNKEENKFDFSG